MYDLMVDEIFELSNYSEAVNRMKGYGLTNEELCCITSMDEKELEGILEDYEDEEDYEND